MNISRLIILSGLALIISLSAYQSKASGVPDQFADAASIVTDTIPMNDRTGDFITGQTYNPFDIMPSIVTQEVEYDAINNRYILIEKIGDEYYRPPTYLTFDEYMEWNAKQQEKEYFNSLAGIQSKKPSLSGKIDPMDKIEVSKGLVDKMFGGTEVNIKPQGNVDLTLGLVDYRRTIGANVTPAQAEQLYIPGDFRIQPRLNVDGSIGEKLNLGFNYDATSTFDFDKKIKLDYSADAFNEDDIIKKIEAGNVSLPLKGTLIQGGQALFGFKTELQFGHLRLTGILSQQRSRQNNLKIENGASVQEFDLAPTDYDENRHFFISHYNRDTYEKALSNLPQINTSFRLAQIEVWVSNDRLEFQNRSRKIVGISDIAEGDIDNYHNESTLYPPNNSNVFLTDAVGRKLPDNRQNELFEAIVSDPEANESDKVNSTLTFQHNLLNTRDYEVFQGRLLSPNEYTFNPQLGTVSLNFRLQPDDALAVSYKYYYTDRCDSVYTVGQLAGEGSETSEALVPGEEPEADKVIFTKLLKSSNQQPKFPSWDLMMKNVYNLRTSNLTRDGFTFDIFYEDDLDDGSLKKYIPLPETQYDPLLNIFKLDALNRYGDPQSDGVLDYVPGVTVIERTGSIVFPVLEPFGNNLIEYFDNLGITDSIFSYPELYDSTITQASFNASEKNKFLMRARVESATSGEINLGPSIPQGSVRVRAGGVTLIENQDYEIDYSLGRLRILNPAYLSQGTPINVTFEDNGAFNLNTKTMNGLRADYDFSKKFSMGGTVLRLKERPFTQKVNIGDDPISNTIYGLDLNYNDDMPWLTSLVDKLPFYSTKSPSSLALTAEGAYLRPGHNKIIDLDGGQGGVVSIDDFEGAISGFSLGGFNLNAWSFASTPYVFPESQLVDSLASGANRARINWYQIDESARASGSTFDPYTRTVDVQDLFDRDNDIGLNRLFTFDLSYYPEERGAYNFDKIGGYPGISAGIEIDNGDKKIKLIDPESRWGGIMRGFQNTDFEAANYEFIEFWVLNPFLAREDGADHTGEDGELVFNLGSVSEDIIKDDLQFFENGIPDAETVDLVPIRNTNYGRVPLKTPITRGFNINSLSEQDLGFDGMNDNQERAKFAEYLSNIPATFQDVYDDPANDNFEYYSSENLRNNEPNILNRFKRFNNPQGNAPLNNINSSNENSFIRGNSFPEAEDLNDNRALDQAESYYEYKVPFKNIGGEVEINSPYYRETKVVNRVNPDGSASEEQWYRFQIPLNSGRSVNGISGFRNIRFLRMYLSKFKTAKTFRMADFQLVRNLWRRSPTICTTDGGISNLGFSIDKVGIQENSTRLPFNYKLPRGIQVEQLLGTFSNIRQDEKSMVLKFENLGDGCNVAVNKLARLNLTQYKRMQLFVHAEDGIENFNDIAQTLPGEKPELSIYIRVGKDLVNNFYEYEMPIQVSDIADPTKESNIWLDTNFVDLQLSKFLEVKKLKLGNNGTTVNGDRNYVEMPDDENEGAFFRIKGTPSLGLIKQVEVGVKNKTGDSQKFLNGQVWINELRCTGLEEKGGVAAQARMQVKMADLGEINLSGNYSSVGFGALDQRLQDRSQEEIIQYDAAATLQLGKVLPQILKLNLPFYAQYSKSISNPRFDPYQLDLSTKEILEVTPDSEVEKRADIADRAATVTTIKSYNFTNVKFDVGSGKMPWSPKNLSATYAYTESNTKAPIIIEELETERKVGIDYRYSMKPLYIQPLKFIKSKNLKFLSEFNFNLIPNTFSFNTTLNRFKNSRTFRLPVSPVFRFEDQRYKWDRNYNVDWDIAKSLRFTFRAQTTSLVDELRQTGIADTPEERQWVDENGDFGNPNYTQSVNDDPNFVDNYRLNNLKRLGRSKNYTHDIGLSFRVPFKNVPILSWISTTADYKAQYGWTGGPLITIDDLGTPLGNTIQNSQTRSINSNFSFDKLYGKSKYLKKIENGGRKTNSRARGSRNSKDKKDVSKKDDKNVAKKDDKKAKKKGDRMPSLAERIIIRPLLSLRSVKVSYREDLGTIVPGFMNQSSLFGLESGFKSPGWDFAAGLQPNIERSNPNNWLQSNQQWFNSSVNFNDQITQNKRHNITAKIKLEPFRDFDIDIDFSKDYRRDHTEIFKSKPENPGDPSSFNQVALYDIGNFEVTHFGLNTLFRDNEELLQVFKQNRLLVSQKLNVTGGNHEINPSFGEGYGPLSSAVNIPAFYAAYTGKNINDINLDIREEVSALSYIPKPNWQLRYDGLSKIPAFKKIFKSFQLKHGYRSTMGVSRFNTNPDYNEATAFSKTSDNGNYYAELEVPAMSINEQFNPIIGVSIKTESDMSINFEWKKSRRLDLNLQATSLTEDLSNEIVFGFGYVLKDFKGFTKKSKRERKKKDSDKDNPDDKKKKNGIDFSKGGLVKNEKGRTLTMNLDMSFRDNVSLIYALGDGTPPEPNRGTKTFNIEPSLEYQLYKNLALRWFGTYSTSEPYNTQQNGFITFATGFTVRFNFN